MNKKSPFSAPEAHDKISRLIALPLLKTEFKEGGAPDYSIDTIIKIQKMVNTRPKIDLKNYKANNNNKKIPVLQILNTTVDNFIYESATPDSDLINKKKIFNYYNNNWATTRQSNLE